MAHPLAELNDSGEGVDDEEAAPRGASHQKAAVVGSKIESAVNGAGDGGRSISGPCGSGSIAARRGHFDRRNGCTVGLAGPRGFWAEPGVGGTVKGG